MLEPVRVLSQQGLVRVELARWDERLVVVKRLVGVSAEVARRLEREADVVRKLDHPNIVPLLAAFDGNLIYAYVPGSDLGSLLDGGALPVARAVKVAADVLRALAHAHLHGVVHCDVKPANVLLKGERALLTDFGFAKDLAMTAITGDQELLGTPNYMAPEQFRGVRTDHRSDLYGVGAMLYHALSGEPPYGSQVIRWLVGDDRVPLEPLPPTAAALEPIVRKALARAAEDRYPEAEAMLDALHAAVPHAAALA
ncbi:MAG: serine/threonine-protein kinase [Trueperaceae bacterium]|jgi:serine/threonine-protein kinase|nr:serine/threonine-protein kinase [Trueperaceae bacterium]